MPQGTDVELAGAGYMLAPGSYKRMQDGAAPGGRAGAPARRLTVEDFAGGQRQALGKGGWDAAGVGAAYGGQGVEPWGNELVHVDAMLDQPAIDRQAFSLVVGNACYVGVGRRLYRSVPVTDGTWANFAVAADLGVGVEISGLARYKDDLLIFCGVAANIRKYNTTSGNLGNPWIAGEKGVVGSATAGRSSSRPDRPTTTTSCG